jgi:micrococcal nuclease
MYEYRAKVDRVVDGDTVDFIVDLGFHINIKIRGRLIGVNTPERGEEDWAKATLMCKQLLAGVSDLDDTVIIRTNKTGKYGRWLVEIDGVTDKLASIWPYDT